MRDEKKIRFIYTIIYSDIIYEKFLYKNFFVAQFLFIIVLVSWKDDIYVDL